MTVEVCPFCGTGLDVIAPNRSAPVEGPRIKPGTGSIPPPPKPQIVPRHWVRNGSALGTLIAPVLAAAVGMLSHDAPILGVLTVMVGGSIVGSVLGYSLARSRGADAQITGVRQVGILVGFAVAGFAAISLLLLVVVAFQGNT